MAKNLINKLLWASGIFLGIKILMWLYKENPFALPSDATCTNANALAGTIIIVGGIFGLIFIISTLGEYLDGDYDRWLKENVDPKLKNICDFINRRNGGCNEQ